MRRRDERELRVAGRREGRVGLGGRDRDEARACRWCRCRRGAGERRIGPRIRIDFLLLLVRRVLQLARIIRPFALLADRLRVVAKLTLVQLRCRKRRRIASD